jgi:hypothetical protein
MNQFRVPSDPCRTRGCIQCTRTTLNAFGKRFASRVLTSVLAKLHAQVQSPVTDRHQKVRKKECISRLW